MLRVWVLVCRVLRFRCAVSILAILLLVLAGAALAQTCTVNSTADSGTGTLRSCLTNASSGTVISFNLPSPSTITLTSATLMVPGGVTIEGPGVNQLTISGNHLFAVFTVTGGNVSISGLTIANGHGTVGDILGAAGANSTSGTGGTGGAVTVSNCTFSGNTSTGGAIIEGGTGGSGGAVTVTDSTFSGNTSIGGVIEGGTGSGGGGGGGAVTVTNNTFSGNTSTGGGNVRGLPVMNTRQALKSVLTSVIYRITAHGISRMNNRVNPVLTFMANYPPCLQNAELPEADATLSTADLLKMLPWTNTMGEQLRFYYVFVFSPPYVPLIPPGGVTSDLPFPGGPEEKRNKAMIDFRTKMIAFIHGYDPAVPEQVKQWELNIET